MMCTTAPQPDRASRLHADKRHWDKVSNRSSLSYVHVVHINFKYHGFLWLKCAHHIWSIHRLAHSIQSFFHSTSDNETFRLHLTSQTIHTRQKRLIIGCETRNYRFNKPRPKPVHFLAKCERFIETDSSRTVSCTS